MRYFRALFFLLSVFLTHPLFALDEWNCERDSVITNTEIADTAAFVESDTSAFEASRELYLHPKFIKPYRFFERSESLNKARIATTAGGIGAMYTAANFWWSAAWYSKYDRGKFQFFNDNGEWLQVDKAAHTFNAYFLTRWGYDLFRWTGVKEKHSIWIGMLIANMWQLSIEVNDGLSPKWGFSWGDISANVSGSVIFGLQQYLWHDQKFTVKISAFPQKYAADLRSRTDALYGTSFGELILKDYNATTFWLTASPGAFIKNPNSRFPKWLSVAVGYGANGMLGGFENRWCSDEEIELGLCPQENIVDRSDIARERQFYLTLDVDFTKIPTRKPALKTFFEILNIVKVPFPALEYNSNRGVRWNWLMF